jgi:hypothetical protein
VAELLDCCRRDQYETSPHHQDGRVTVHVFRPTRDGDSWYIKLYFIEDEDGDDLTTMFISVHPSGE